MARVRRIAIVGKMGSGKTTLAQALVDKHSFTRLSFAQPVKEIAYEMLSTMCELLDFPMVDHYDDIKSLPGGRTFLQIVGTDLGRDSFGFPNVWVEEMDRIIRSKSEIPLVIDDCRFPNEYDLLMDYGFEFVKLMRDEQQRIEYIHSMNPNLTDDEMYAILDHESERHVETMDADLVVKSLSVPQLRLAVCSAIVQYPHVNDIVGSTPWSTFGEDSS